MFPTAILEQDKQRTSDGRERRTASPVRPLWQAFVRQTIDALTAEDGSSDPVKAVDPEDVFAAVVRDDERRATPEAEVSPTLPVEYAMAAVRLAGCIEDECGLIDKMRNGSPVVTVLLPDKDSLNVWRTVMLACAFGKDASLISSLTLDGANHATRFSLDGRFVAFLDCDVEGKARKMLERRALTALSLCVPICAFTSDAVRGVPTRIRTTADATLTPAAWTAEQVASVISAVTGETVEVEEASWIGHLVPDDLRMSVSRARGAASSLARLRSAVEARNDIDGSLPDVRMLHGYGDAAKVAVEMLEDITAYKAGKIDWSEMPRGLLLAGPTGTGKTFFVRCFARTAGLPLVQASFAAWQSAGEGHLGDCLGAMRRSFAEARAAAPCILFMDEADSIGDRSTFPAQHSTYSTQVVNGLLEELDGISAREGVIVLAATNDVARIDPAVLRPGRLDRIVTLGLPTVPELSGIFRTNLGDDLAGVDLTAVALAARGASGAAVTQWVRHARGSARRAGRALSSSDLLTSVRDGRPSLPDDQRRRIALHEAGHACAAVVLDLGSVDGITIHDTGGTTEIAPTMRTTTREHAVACIVHLLAGRAAEKKFLGSVSAGAGGSTTSDLALAMRMALGIEASWGLGAMGPVWLGEPGRNITILGSSPVFSSLAATLLRHGEAEADRLVRQYAEAITRCADHLLVTGYLDGESTLAALGELSPFAIRPDVEASTAEHLTDQPA